MSRTIAQLAHEAGEWFEVAKRDDGDESRYTKMRDGRPEWVFDMTFAAHGDLLPNDWSYEAVAAALAHVSDCGYETADDAREGSHEFADSHVDVYTSARLAWLASNLVRVGLHRRRSRGAGLARGLALHD